jgi:hypothetical protein
MSLVHCRNPPTPITHKVINDGNNIFNSSADMLFSCYHLPVWLQRLMEERRSARYIYRIFTKMFSVPQLLLVLASLYL